MTRLTAMMLCAARGYVFDRCGFRRPSNARRATDMVKALGDKFR